MKVVVNNVFTERANVHGLIKTRTVSSFSLPVYFALLVLEQVSVSVSVLLSVWEPVSVLLSVWEGEEKVSVSLWVYPLC